MKKVSIFLLSFVMALALARPAFALVDGADLDFNAYYGYAIVTVDYVTYNRFFGTDIAAGNYCRRNVLVKKERGEDGIRFIPHDEANRLRKGRK